MEVTRFNIRNQQNENLVCELNKPKNSIENRPSILILHALTGKKENKTINFLAKNLPNYCYTTIQFDFSGHGESEGKLEEATISKQIADIKSILSNLNEIDTKEVILIGNSFSVITALAFARNKKSVAALILLSGRANYMEYINSLKKVENKYKLFEEIFIDENFVKDYKRYNPLKIIKKINIPVLIIHGGNDEVIPKEDAQLFYATSSSVMKELFIVPKADHRYSTDEYKKIILNKILSFLSNLKK